MAARAPVCAFVQSVALRVNRTDLSHIWNWSTIKALFPPPVVLQIGGVGGRGTAAVRRTGHVSGKLDIYEF